MADAWSADGQAAASFAGDIPDNHTPSEAGLVTAPRLTELAFQAAGIYEIGTTGTMALPTHIDRVEYRIGASEEGAKAVVTPVDGGFDAVVVNAKGKGLVRMSGYRTVQMPAPLAEELAAPLRAAMAPDS